VYFVTICTQNREYLFGDIVDGKMRLNAAGEMVTDEWAKIAEIHDGIQLDEWVVMPNYFHGIVVFTKPVGAISVGAIHELPLPDSPTQPIGAERRNMALPKLIGRFKMLSAKRINELTNYAKPSVQNYGNAIIGNTLSAMNRN
jgi:putative transposase